MESDFDKKVQSKAKQLKSLESSTKHKKQLIEDEEKKSEEQVKTEEPVEKKAEEPLEKKTDESLDVESAVKSVLGAKLSKKQLDEAGDTSPEPETKDNKELESKLQELIKQSKEINEFTQQ